MVRPLLQDTRVRHNRVFDGNQLPY
jgi:hypothetical protein